MQAAILRIPVEQLGQDAVALAGDVDTLWLEQLAHWHFFQRVVLDVLHSLGRPQAVSHLEPAGVLLVVLEVLLNVPAHVLLLVETVHRVDQSPLVLKLFVLDVNRLHVEVVVAEAPKEH